MVIADGVVADKGTPPGEQCNMQEMASPSFVGLAISYTSFYQELFFLLSFPACCRQAQSLRSFPIIRL